MTCIGRRNRPALILAWILLATGSGSRAPASERGRVELGDCLREEAVRELTGGSHRHPIVAIEDAKGYESPPDHRLMALSVLDELAALTEGDTGPARPTLPRGQTVVLEPGGGRADHDNGEIHLPHDFRSTRHVQPPKETLTVYSHEWGHSLLETNLRKRASGLLEELDGLETRIEALGATLKTRQTELERLTRSWEAQKDPKSLKWLRWTRRMITAERKELNGAYALRARLRGAFKPYNEFFADVIAVAWRRDGSAVYDAMASATTSKSQKLDAEVRDFKRHHPLEGWGYEGPYAILAPSRTWIWDRYLSRPAVQARSADLIDALIDAVAETTARRFKRVSEQLTPEQVNREFMASVERHLALRGL